MNKNLIISNFFLLRKLKFNSGGSLISIGVSNFDYVQAILVTSIIV